MVRLTRRAGVRVPSTSNRTTVFLMGRSANAGTTLPAAAILLWWAEKSWSLSMVSFGGVDSRCLCLF